MEKYIYDVFDRLDPSKTNTNFYKAFFSKMTDREFDAFFKKFFEDKDAYLTLTVKAFENDLQMDNIQKAAKFMKVPLYEYVAQPFFSKDPDHPIVTPYPVPVGYIHEKRVQQTSLKKNSTSIEISTRDPRTGQVINDDKNSKQSIDENYSMMAQGSELGIKEFMSFRSDDIKMKEAAYASIRQNGYVAMKDLPDHIENKTSLNMLDAYFIAMGIKSDLVTEGYTLVKTMK
jgi:hypothetical protein